MKENTKIIYNHFYIYFNRYGEYCVCNKMTGSMVSYNAGFKTLKVAKIFINKINPTQFSNDEIEKIADETKRTYEK